mgnify:CR=1 FL=1
MMKMKNARAACAVCPEGAIQKQEVRTNGADDAESERDDVWDV